MRSSLLLSPQIVRADQSLDTWRPRVHGTQLKALLNCRLPEQPEEYAAVESEISSIRSALRVRVCVAKPLCITSVVSLHAPSKLFRPGMCAYTNASFPKQRIACLVLTCEPSLPLHAQPDVTPQVFIAELKRFISGVEVWWDSRNSRRPTGDPSAPAGGK